MSLATPRASSPRGIASNTSFPTLTTNSNSSLRESADLDKKQNSPLFQNLNGDSQQSDLQSKRILKTFSIEHPDDPQIMRTKYSGQTLNSVPDGYGIMIFVDHHKDFAFDKSCRYTSVANKEFRPRLIQKSVYCGEWVGGKQNGYGFVRYYSPTIIYSRKLVGGKQNGDKIAPIKSHTGQWEYSGEWEYSGQWENGKRHGYGLQKIFVDQGAITFRGRWKNGALIYSIPVHNVASEGQRTTYSTIEISRTSNASKEFISEELERHIPNVLEKCEKVKEISKKLYKEVWSKTYIPETETEVREKFESSKLTLQNFELIGSFLEEESAPPARATILPTILNLIISLAHPMSLLSWSSSMLSRCFRRR